jgi:hypothetical protein
MRVEFRQAEADFKVVDTTYLCMLFIASANGSPAIVIMPKRLRPAAMRKAAFGVLIRATWRLAYAVQRDEFSDD